MKRLMVTGGAGFIGSNFVHYWREKHPDDTLVIVDALTYAGNRSNLDGLLGPACRLERLDINDTTKIHELLKDDRIDVIVHFAAESHVDRSISGPDVFVQANILGTHSLLKAARGVWLDSKASVAEHRFHHVSTDEVYGSLTLVDPAFTEDTPYAPNSPYAASKASSDFLVRAYHHTYGLKTTISNCSNNYGPRHYPEKLIPLTITNALTGKQLPVYGNGRNVRDWLYVDDHARGIDRILRSGRSGETYNIGGGNEWANIDIVKQICVLLDNRFDNMPLLGARFPACPAAAGKPCASLIAYVQDRAGHDFRYAIDGSRSREELGFSPSTSFDEGLAATVDWYLGNEAWWRPLVREDRTVVERTDRSQIPT